MPRPASLRYKNLPDSARLFPRPARARETGLHSQLRRKHDRRSSTDRGLLHQSKGRTNLHESTALAWLAAGIELRNSRASNAALVNAPRAGRGDRRPYANVFTKRRSHVTIGFQSPLTRGCSYVEKPQIEPPRAPCNFRHRSGRVTIGLHRLPRWEYESTKHDDDPNRCGREAGFASRFMDVSGS